MSNNQSINGNSRILKWRYCPYKAIFCGDIPLHSPYIGLIYDRYLQFRFLKWPLNKWDISGITDARKFGYIIFGVIQYYWDLLLVVNYGSVIHPISP